MNKLQYYMRDNNLMKTSFFIIFTFTILAASKLRTCARAISVRADAAPPSTTGTLRERPTFHSELSEEISSPPALYPPLSDRLGEEARAAERTSAFPASVRRFVAS